jgi:hypothetical protein
MYTLHIPKAKRLYRYKVLQQKVFKWIKTKVCIGMEFNK